MAKLGEIPAVVSKRNEFSPADEFVENALPYLPSQFKHVNFRGWLLQYTETVIRGVAHHFGVAADRGIQQAAELLCDPAFYETRRQKRAKWREQMQVQAEKQRLEAAERRLCPTAEQIAQDTKWCEDQLAYHEAGAEKCRATLERLRALSPKNIRLVPFHKIQ